MNLIGLRMYSKESRAINRKTCTSCCQITGRPVSQSPTNNTSSPIFQIYSDGFVGRILLCVKLFCSSPEIPLDLRLRYTLKNQTLTDKKNEAYSASLFMVISIVSPVSSRNLYSVTGNEES